MIFNHCKVAAFLIFIAHCAFAGEAAIAQNNEAGHRRSLNCSSVNRPIIDKVSKLSSHAGLLAFVSQNGLDQREKNNFAKNKVTVVDLSDVNNGEQKNFLKGYSTIKADQTIKTSYSPLISEPNIVTDQSRFLWKTQSFSVLTYRTETQSRVLASIARSEKFLDQNIHYVWFPASASNPQGFSQDLFALEQLYLNAVNDLATGKFTFEAAINGTGHSNDESDQMEHAQLLAKIAQLRACLIETAGGGVSTKPKSWQVIRIEPIPSKGDRDQVAVRLSKANEVMEGATIFFRQEPHMECSAKTSSSGVAACHLEDTHGHEHQHGHGSDRMPVVATYPGKIQTTSVLLPSTATLTLTASK
jgi:hypothetical protein